MLTIAFLVGLIAFPLYVYRRGVGVVGLFATTTIVVLVFELIVVSSFTLFKIVWPNWLYLKSSLLLRSMPWQSVNSTSGSTTVQIWTHVFPALVWGFLAVATIGLTRLRALNAPQMTIGLFWVLLTAFVAENLAYVVLSLLFLVGSYEIALQVTNLLMPAWAIADFIAFAAFFSLLAHFSQSLWRRFVGAATSES